jgi:uncharacterized protein YbjQ (UPF0145 family)
MEIILLQLAILVVPLIVFGLIIGRTVEKRHFRNIEQRESEFQNIFVTQLKTFPNATTGGPAPNAVMSEVVISSDYLKTWLSKWRNLFGGEMKSFRSLQERAKREAILRLSEQTVAQGHNAICNVRIAGADIGGNTTGGKNKVVMAAIIATGTAYTASPSNTASFS